MKRPDVVAGGFGKRAEPPADMAADQAEIWRKTVATEPPEFFATDATKCLLADYCRHRATVDRMTAIIEAVEGEWYRTAAGIKMFSDLCKVRDRESRAAADKAVKLRVTNQSRWTPHTGGTAAMNVAKMDKKPWE
jgi:hypothetical protein